MERFYSTSLKCEMQQVSIRKARRVFNGGGMVWAIPCRMRFDNIFQQACPFDKLLDDDFDKAVNTYRYYNCDSERGRYPRFYVFAQP